MQGNNKQKLNPETKTGDTFIDKESKYVVDEPKSTEVHPIVIKADKQQSRP